MVALLPILGCAGSVPPPQGDGGATGEDAGNACGTPDPALAAADPATLFGAATIPTFDVYLPLESWEWLKVHAREETFVEADACYNGQAIGRVGVRFKGSYGSLYNCFDAAGQNTCRKLPMKIKFDKYVDKQRFYGLKRLNFQSYRYDNSYLKERLSYDLYRAMGVVTPRAAWARLRVNGEDQGLFGMVEQPDGPFAKDRFPATPDNNMYKELWPGKADENLMVSRLETNTKTPNVSAFKDHRRGGARDSRAPHGSRVPGPFHGRGRCHRQLRRPHHLLHRGQSRRGRQPQLLLVRREPDQVHPRSVGSGIDVEPVEQLRQRAPLATDDGGLHAPLSGVDRAEPGHRTGVRSLVPGLGL
jgi:hypothetical protein